MGGTFSPTSAIFQVNALGIKLLLLALAAGIAFGLLRAPFFRARPDLRKEKSVQRHSVATAVLHWVNAAAFLLGIYTAAVLLRWIGDPFGLTNIYILHYVAAGLIFFALGAVAMNAFTYGTTSRHRVIPTAADFREFGAEILGYLGVRGDRGFFGFFPSHGKHPPLASSGDKYTATERVMSYPLWVIVVTVLVVTGVIKALRYIYPIPNSWLTVVTPLHDIAAYATVVMLILHAGAVLVIKTNWPLLRSMATTRQDLAYAREHHAQWLKDLEAGEAPPPAPQRPGVGRPVTTHDGPAGGSE